LEVVELLWQPTIKPATTSAESTCFMWPYLSKPGMCRCAAPRRTWRDALFDTNSVWIFPKNSSEAYFELDVEPCDTHQ
jgi:hypothetical protein